jgi:GxxExxY protein
LDFDDRLVYRILESARLVHSTLGPGFVESIYVRALVAELTINGFQVDREKVIKVWYGDRVVGKHRLDMLVDGAAIIELKANRGIVPVHVAQVKSYLHASNYPFGLILNFGTTELQWELIRATRDSQTD